VARAEGARAEGASVVFRDAAIDVTEAVNAGVA
jgi:hypothetical protein